MPPMPVSYSVDCLEKVLGRFGTYRLEDFEDGQTRWGNQPMATPYIGSSIVSHPYPASSEQKMFDIFTVRAIVDKLGKGARQSEIDAELEKFFSSDDWK